MWEALSELRSGGVVLGPQGVLIARELLESPGTPCTVAEQGAGPVVSKSPSC